MVAAALILASTATTIFCVVRLSARSRPGRGTLLGLVAASRLELLQQGAARGVAHPREAVNSSGLSVCKPPATRGGGTPACGSATGRRWPRGMLAAGILRSPRVGLMVVAAGVAHAGGADRFRDHDNRSALSRVLVVGSSCACGGGSRGNAALVLVRRDSRLASVSWPSTRCCFYRPRWWGSACFIGVASSAGRACGSCSPERRPGGRPSCSGTRGTTGCRSAMSSDRWVAGARAGASGGWAPCSSSAARRE